MEDDLARSPSSSKPAQQPLLDIDLNAPPPLQDVSEDVGHPAQIRNFRGVEDDDNSEDDEEAEDSEDDDEFLDVDNMSYEELLALGERIGTQCRGLHPDIISALPCHQFVQKSNNSECNLCVICRYDIEDGVYLLTLPCKHFYHSDCIKSWLQIQKNCPICNAEVML